MNKVLTKALGGDLKAMEEVLGKVKDNMFGLAGLLLGDEKKAAAVMPEAVKELFYRLKNNASADSDEKLKDLAMTVSAESCKKYLLKENVRSFAPVKVAGSSKDLSGETEDFKGDAAACESSLRNAIADLPNVKKFAYVLKTVSFLDNKAIAKILDVKESLLVSLYNSARGDISEKLQQEGSSLNLNQASSLLYNGAFGNAVPENVNEGIAKAIAPLAKDTTKLKKTIAMAAAAVLLVAAILVLIWRITASNKYIAEIKIKDYGTVVVELDGNEAPKTVKNFVKLAEEGFYDGLTFHRILKNTMMQGGDPFGDGSGGSKETIVGEFGKNGISNTISHVRGTISMARGTNYNSARSQFFIVRNDHTDWDGLYAGFGHVIEGMEVVDAVCEDADPTDANGTIEKEKQPVIETITVRKK